jgi:hypothetical protein
MAINVATMMELFQEFSSSLYAKLDLIQNLKGNANVNPVDELAILKARWLAFEKADGYSDAIITNTSSSLQLLTAVPTINLDTAMVNPAEDKQQVRQVSTFATGKLEPLMEYVRLKQLIVISVVASPPTLDISAIINNSIDATNSTVDAIYSTHTDKAKP